MPKLKISYFFMAQFIVLTSFLQNDKNTANNDWPKYGHDFSNSKYSELKEISTENISQIRQIWSHEDTASHLGWDLFWNPLVAHNRMIAFLPSQKLAALNPKTGQKLWEFTPDSTLISTWTRGCNYITGKNGKPDFILFVYGSTLYSINAATGKLIKTFGKNGKVDFYTGLNVPKNMTSKIHVTNNTPGVIFNDLLIIGCKVPDELPAVSGDIRAFNIHTGALAWVFHTIPKKGEFGYETWAPTSRDKNGGANCWAGMALDQRRGIVYVPTASPSFDFYGADRPGTNLFANCLLALDAKTGKRLWHFQTTHHDLWDRDNGSPPNLLTVNHDGKNIDAVALITKMSYVFLFERATGRPLFPIKEVPVPTISSMPGEKPWPTQPIPTKPAAFARQAFLEEFFNENPSTHKFVIEQLAENKYTTGLFDPPSLAGGIYVPAAQGGGNWGGAALNPTNNILFVPSTDMPWILKLKELNKLKENNNMSGESLFKMNCASCHGAAGKGNTVGPNITSKVKSYTATKLESAIKNGSGRMPSFKSLPQLQINAIVSFLKNNSTKKTAETSKISEDSVEPYGFSGYDFWKDAEGIPAMKPPYGTLNAIDLNAGEILWQVPLGDDPHLLKKGMKNTGMMPRGGGICTAGGLIFIASTYDQIFRAYSQKTGEVLWQTKLPGNGTSTPSTYAIDGKQYVTVAVGANLDTGYGGGYVTFAL